MRTRWMGLTAIFLAGCEPVPPTTAVNPPPAREVAKAAPQPIRRGVFAPARHSGAALGLTASDGTGLRLTALAARSVVNDPLAFTELRLVFENPQSRTLEGTFRITLPQGATVSRFAMRQDDRWQEGEVVETQAARQAYEDFLHRKQDPALLEQAAGNEFSARVFPIPARGRKELIISYSQEMDRSAESFRLPLGGLPQIDQVEAEVYGPGEGTLLGAFRQERFQPQGDFAVELLPQDRGPGLRSGDLMVTRVTPVADAQPDPLGAALLLVDTSASRALGFDAQLKLLTTLADRIARSAGASTPLAVVAFDQSMETVYDGPAGGFGPDALGRLQARGAFGASDLGEALRASGEKARERGLRRVVVVTDGVATAGSEEAAALRERAARLKEAGVERLDVVAVGGIRDDALLKRLSTAGLARDGVVADGAQDPDALWRRLSSRTRSGVPVRVEGARWWYPKQLDGVQQGDEVLVYAEVPATTPVSVTIGERTVTPALTATERPLLERSVARARIASLLDQERTPDVRRQVIDLSTRHRVLSPYTAMLVLETDEDYARFKIDRSALVNILTVQRGQLSVAGRTTPPEPLWQAADAPDPVAKVPPSPDDGKSDSPEIAEAQKEVEKAPEPTAGAPVTQAPRAAPPPPRAIAEAPPPPAPPPPPPRTEAADAKPSAADKSDAGGESFGAGGLGLSGSGEAGGGTGLGGIGTIGRGAGAATGQGFGSGHGRLSGSHRTVVPEVRMGATTVSGRIPPEVIQRIVRQNFGRFRLCYENGLRSNPDLQGRVVVHFVIERDGSVKGVRNNGSDLPNPNVVNCVVRSFSGLSFPQPEGGVVTVIYPLSFAPGRSLDGPSRPDGPSRSVRTEPEREVPAAATPYTGRFKTVMEKLASDPKAALSEALAWRNQHPADILALVAVGEAHERLGAPASAARAYGSLIDLFPARADLRRYAASRMERLDKSVLASAVDSLTKARDQRPDHPSSHRMLAMALLREGEYEQAFKAEAAGLKRRYPSGRFAGHERIMREDLGLIAAAWRKAQPARRQEIDERLKEAGGAPESAPSLRFVLTWETDANDVDFHIFDSKGGHAYYGRPRLPSGGELYADVTTGYGPECFTIRGPAALRPDYTLQAHYYSRGPMGYGMGKLEVIDHDGQGNISFEERPFVVMQDGAYIDLGQVKKKR